MALWSNQDVAGAYPKYLPVGRILSIRVTAGGTGYTNGASVAVTIGAPGAGGVQATATAVVSGGIVQSIKLTNTGSKYATAPAVTMATGTGLTVQVVLEPIVYDSAKIFFVDATEASLESSKRKGIHCGGWYYINTYENSDGDTRYKSECLISMSTASATSGDAEDVMVPDVSTLVNISVQPASQTISLGTTTSATFTVTAAITPSGTPTYQWQSAEVGSTKYSNLSGKTTSSLALTGLTLADNGKRYRVKISATGAPVSTSAVATLTVTA